MLNPCLFCKVIFMQGRLQPKDEWLDWMHVVTADHDFPLKISSTQQIKSRTEPIERFEILLQFCHKTAHCTTLTSKSAPCRKTAQIKKKHNRAKAQQLYVQSIKTQKTY